MTNLELINARIKNRTATRREWHARRRLLSARQRGINLPDLVLAPAVMTSEFSRAARRWFLSPQAQALRAITKRLPR